MPLADADEAVIERFDPGEDLQQRGFAGAVRAHQADAVVGRDHPVSVFEEELVAETFPGGGQLNHGVISIVS